MSCFKPHKVVILSCSFRREGAAFSTADWLTFEDREGFDCVLFCMSLHDLPVFENTKLASELNIFTNSQRFSGSGIRIASSSTPRTSQRSNYYITSERRRSRSNAGQIGRSSLFLTHLLQSISKSYIEFASAIFIKIRHSLFCPSQNQRAPEMVPNLLPSAQELEALIKTFSSHDGIGTFALEQAPSLTESYTAIISRQ